MVIRDTLRAGVAVDAGRGRPYGGAQYSAGPCTEASRGKDMMANITDYIAFPVRVEEREGLIVDQAGCPLFDLRVEGVIARKVLHLTVSLLNAAHKINADNPQVVASYMAEFVAQFSALPEFRLGEAPSENTLQAISRLDSLCKAIRG